MASDTDFILDNPEIETRIGMVSMGARAETPARTFMRELQVAERTGDLSRLLGLFSERAILRRMVHENHQSERVDAQSFWRAYLDAFAEIRSEFGNVLEGIRGAFLEWRSEGRLKSGASFVYEGVSALDFEPTGEIRGFRTYYDSACFLTH